MAEVGSAYVTLIPSARGFGKSIDKQIGGDVTKTGATVGKRFGGAIKLGAAALVGGVVGNFLKGSLDEAREAQKVGAQTAAVIKSTGGAANVTAKQVETLAGSLSRKTGIDDEVIQSGQNMLLTFKNIRNEAGKGNDIFNQSTKTLVDMATAMGTEPKQAAIQLGKALNDPIKGITALSRVGVTFTEQQKKTIKRMVETGDVLSAQKIILKELNSEFGGSAEAQATAADKAKVAWGNLQETIGTALLPTVDKLSNVFTNKIAPAVSGFVGEMQDGTGAGGRFANALGNIVDTGRSIVGFFTGLPGPVKKYGAALLIATTVMSKFSGLVGPTIGSLGSFTTSMRSAEFRAATFAQKMQQVGTGVRTLAGGVGLGLIADSSTRAAGGLSTLESAAGGALSGAALGAFAGPPGAAIGAAVGGLAGAAIGLSRNTKDAGDAATGSIGSWKSYGDTLDTVTGKVTALTRQEAFNRLQKSDLIETTRSLGISDREAVTAITQQGAAREKLSAQITGSIANTKKAIELQTFMSKTGSLARREEAKGNLEAAKSRLKSLQALQREVGAVDKATAAKQHEIAVTRQFSSAIKSLPKAVQTEIRQKGLQQSRKAIVDLTRKYNLTPKDVRTLIREQGGKPTKQMVDNIIASAKTLDKQRPTPKVSIEGAAAARAAAQSITNAINNIPLFRTVTVRVNRAGGSYNAGNDLAGKRAHGGPIDSGRTYLVGERGPELFTSSQSGRITPNHRLSSALAEASRSGGALVNIEQMVTHDPAEAGRRMRVEANKALALASMP